MKLGLKIAAPALLLLACFFAGYGAAAEPRPEDAGAVVEDNHIVAHLYFADRDHRFLVAEKVLLPLSASPTDIAAKVVTNLIRGPLGDLQRTLPMETELRSVFVDFDGIAYVDLTYTVREKHPGGILPELLAIYSIVNSLVLNIESVDAVKLMIEGRDAPTLAGHVDLRFPFKANMLWIR